MTTTQTGERWLLGLRISHKTDRSTSIDKQRQSTTAHVAKVGGTVVDEAVDENVSGAVNPFARGDLGEWLTNRMKDFDAIVFHHLDRASRETTHILLFLEWAEDQGKRIVLLGPTFYDTATAGTGERIGLVVNAEVARAIRRDIQAKVIESVKLDRLRGKYLGGRIPPWLTTEPHDSGKGKKLVLKPLDSKEVKIVLELIERIENEEPYQQIIDDFARREVPTPHALRATVGPKKKHKESKLGPGGWSIAGIRYICNNRLLIGEKEVVKTHKDGTKTRTIVRGADGRAVVYCKGLIEYDRFMALRQIVETPREQQATKDRSALQGVVTCLACGAARYHNTAKKNKAAVERYSYYRCSRGTRRKACADKLVRADWVHFYLDRAVDNMIGAKPIIDKIEPPRVDYSGKLAQLMAERDAISRLYAITNSASGRAGYEQTLMELDRDITELERLVSDPPKPQYVLRGETFWDKWEGGTWHERGDLLRRIGAIFAIGHDDDQQIIGNLILPEDIDERLRAIPSGKAAAPAGTFPYPATEYLTKESK